MTPQDKKQEILEAVNNFIGEPPEMLKEYKDKSCPICGQPTNKSPQIIELKRLISQALDDYAKAYLKAAVEECVPDAYNIGDGITMRNESKQSLKDKGWL